MLLSQSGQALLLGVGVDVCADAESDGVEERNPSLLGQELLRKGEGDWRSDPSDTHDGHEAGTDGGTDLMPGASSGDDGHGGQVDRILDRRDLRVD